MPRLLLVLALISGTSRADDTRRTRLLSEAMHAIHHADSIREAHPEEADREYGRAILRFETLLDAGVRNAAILYNLGNAHLQRGDYGKAILAYERARRLDPGASDIARNLALARVRAGVAPATPKPEGGYDMLLLRQVSQSGRLRLWAGLWVVLWGGACLRCVGAWRRWVPRWALGVWMVPVLWMSVSVGVEMREGAVARGIVLGTDDDSRTGGGQGARASAAHGDRGGHPLREGDGEGFAVVTGGTVRTGEGVRILERRGAWVQVMTAEGARGWLPRSVVGTF